MRGSKPQEAYTKLACEPKGRASSEEGAHAVVLKHNVQTSIKGPVSWKIGQIFVYRLPCPSPHQLVLLLILGRFVMDMC